MKLLKTYLDVLPITYHIMQFEIDSTTLTRLNKRGRLSVMDERTYTLIVK